MDFASRAFAPDTTQSTHTYTSNASAASEATVAATPGVIANPCAAPPWPRNPRWNTKNQK